MYRIYIDDFWLIGDIIILKTKKEIKMKRITKSLPFKLLLGVCIGIIVGLLAGEGLMNIIVTVKYILGQYINFCVPLIVIGFIAPSIPKLGNNASAATLAVALRCARKSKVLRNDMIDFGIPLFANIHLCGSVLTETFFVMVVSKILYGDIPDMKMMVLFCILLGIFAIGAPGVPGGTVMASLGLITGILGFNETGTALILTVFALQDSFGTACNITGDGALTLILTGYANRHGISEKTVKNSDC